MEKPIRKEMTYSHFSHKHPLEYTRLLPNGHTTCFGCKLKILPGNYFYMCKTCSFFLHQVCFNMPKNVSHPCDPNHNLRLQSIPSLSSKVSIKCKVCEKQVKGFYYSCFKCIDYYHTLCLAAPLSIKAPSHHHVLNVEFSPLYDFECDLCEKPSYSGWLYHCNVCEFDAHLSCVLSQILHQNQRSDAPLLPLDSAIMDKGDELVELLTMGAKVSRDIKSPEDLPQNQSVLSKDPIIPSFQLSDACFSIDFEKSLLCKDQASQAGKMGIPEETEAENPVQSILLKNQLQGIEESNHAKAHSRGSSYGVNTKSSKSVGSHIWMEMEQDTEKRLAIGSKGKSENDASFSCSYFPKLVMHLFYLGGKRSTKIAKQEGKAVG